MNNVILVVQVGGIIMTVDSSFDPNVAEDMAVDVPKTFWEDAGIEGPPSDGWWIGMVSFHTSGPDMEGDYDTEAHVVWRTADPAWLKDGEHFCQESMDNVNLREAAEKAQSEAYWKPNVVRWQPDFAEALAREPEPAPWEKT
ncbi:hypothetical protein UFOVP1382_30 [uncultured Caudovirales phage]|uniref:Uncharacterized protein n=1 Tax=uncultured Caudovirales phage TaxID=2100421 RepID=A0A6J5RXS0_9CAUD|nr:hypothetical protein UFOVP1382_30 [uncultured Caudovirales phage]